MGTMRKAWHDTFSNFGGWGTFYGILAIPPVSFLVQYYRGGWDRANAEIDAWLYSVLLSAGLVFCLVFLKNLALAPYRLELEKRLNLEAELAKVSNSLSMEKAYNDRLRGPLLDVSGNYIAVEARQFVTFVIVNLIVSNRGEQASAAMRWNCRIKGGGAEKAKIDFVRNVEMTLGNNRFQPENGIFEELYQPLQPGSYRDGHFIVAIDKVFSAEELITVDIRIRFEDVFGNEYVVGVRPAGEMRGIYNWHGPFDD